MLENFSYDQSRRPRKGDIISYFDLDCEDWMKVQIISTQKPSSVHRDYYNIKFIEIVRDDDGVYLEPGSYWTFGSPTPLNQLPQHEEQPNTEVNRSPALAPPSRDVSSVPSSSRLETQPDLADPLSSFSPSWQFSRAQELNPSSPLVSNKVYSIPSLPGGLLDTHKLDKKVLAKAASLSLHPRQEHMRLNIARSLVAHKPRSPRNKSKMSLLNISKRL